MRICTYMYMYEVSSTCEFPLQMPTNDKIIINVIDAYYHVVIIYWSFLLSLINTVEFSLLIKIY